MIIINLTCGSRLLVLPARYRYMVAVDWIRHYTMCNVDTCWQADGPLGAKFESFTRNNAALCT